MQEEAVTIMVPVKYKSAIEEISDFVEKLDQSGKIALLALLHGAVFTKYLMDKQQTV